MSGPKPLPSHGMQRGSRDQVTILDPAETLTLENSLEPQPKEMLIPPESPNTKSLLKALARVLISKGPSTHHGAAL